MSASGGFLEADGHRLEYRWFGDGPSSRAVVLLHDGLGCVSTWRDFPGRLAERIERPIFAYSRVGYGGSDPCELPRPWTYMHHEGRVVLPQVLERAGIEDAWLVGHSDGGSISIVYSGLQGRGEGPPATGPRVTRLALIAAHVFNEPLSRDSILEAGRRFEETDLRARLERHHKGNVECAFRGWRDAWLSREFESWNLEEFLGSISLPIMLLQGQDDNFGTLAQVEVIERGLSGPVERVLIPDCAHRPHREQPDLLLETLGRFLS